ncbi:hypothetical protein ONA91_29645 [Micromonospora sp. DR5-3]|uniref:hypothetical protein n=1 Tax=unclassified Micromonospora TaxID=2617518 RepID=UPI0011DBC15C|nr:MULTISPECIES: hypothetical protein [unclassified Micromonospora]MCW3818610.1 hypothetical protein [Micromonospora sp. DR5-3]TYC20064.1 hypothetical protein FXF52_33415 [Micromonospora sp. MP36]
MPAEHEVIDLDEHDHRPAESGGITPDRLVARRKMNVRLVAAFVVGAVLGGVGVSELRDSRDERERNASVSLVAFPESSISRRTDITTIPAVVQMDGRLAVINAGPAPITVRAAAGQRPGIQVRDTGQSRLLRPGGTGWIDVQLRIECSTAFESEPLSIRFSVETADRQIREVSYPVAVEGSAWDRGAEQPCTFITDLAKRAG